MYQKTTLDSGLRIISENMPYTRSVCINIFIGAGSRYEPADEAGLSHFIEHLCFKGTQKRATAREISEAIEGVGGVLNAGTDRELTCYWVKVARQHYPLALDVLVDMLRNSSFDAAEIEKERKVIIEELNRCLDSPSERVDMLIDELVWPDQALGRDVAGSRETVSKLSREMALGYLASQYGPSSAVVSVAGNITHDEVVTSVAEVFAGWPQAAPRPWYPAEGEQALARSRVEPRQTEQAHLCLAVPGLSHLHPDRFTLDLLNVVLGEGMSSRLFLEVREKRGLAYAVHSFVSHFMDSGAVTIYAGVDPGHIEGAVGAVLGELARLRDDKVPELELIKAKEMAKGRMLLGMEDTMAVARWLAAQELLMGHIRTVDEVLAIVDAIAAEDIQRVASALFVGTKLNLAVVGPFGGDANLQALLKL